MRLPRLGLAVLVALLTAAAVRAATLPEIAFEKYELPNGLDVILHEDHSIPMVAVNVWYHVGSKNEKPRRTGFAHLFEHMMFQGSEHAGGEYFEPLEKIGGAVNGSTTEDRTNYWENVPSNYLELALWLEADRMGYLLPAMDLTKLDTQRDVVKNERRERMDNQPYARSYETLLSMVYPEGHPYSWPVIGYMEDLSAASLDDVSDFFKRYYAPNNASLCIAGDFEPATARKLVEKYFASIPPGPPIERLRRWVPVLEGEKRASMEDDVKLPRLYLVWPSPPLFADGDAEMDMLGDILASGKTSRLYKALVYEQQIAQDVTSYQDAMELTGNFRIQVTAREGHTLAEIERAVEAELERLRLDGVTGEELEQVKDQAEASFVRALQRAGGFGGKADRMNDYNTRLGDPGKFEWDLERYSKASVEDVNRVLRATLDPAKRAVLHVVPQGELAEAEALVDRGAEPQPMPERPFEPPEIQRARLKNGLELLLVEDHRLPLVHVKLALKSGWSDDPTGRPGTARLTADLLDEETESMSALEISDAAESLGASLGTSSSFDGSSVDLNVLKKNLKPALDIMAGMVLEPTFPGEELERKRKIYQGRIQQESKQPWASAYKTWQRVVYGPEHPYAQPFTGSGTPDSIQAIQRDDLEDYYEAHYKPNNAALIVVGDMGLDEAKKTLEAAFGGWKQGRVPSREIPTPRAPAQTEITIVDKPGAPQSVIVAGHLGLRRSDPEFLAVEVMNNVLGGMFTSRINMNLREDKGCTYGADSMFTETRGVGAFAVFAPVQADATKESTLEIVKELRDLVGSRPLSDEEIAISKSNMTRRFPRRFQTYSGIANQLADLVTYDLPYDDLESYIGRVASIDGRMATDAAKQHVHPDALAIVVVGDRDKVEPALRELGFGTIKHQDASSL